MGVKLAFTGDIAFSQHTKVAFQNPDFLEESIRSWLCASDHCVCNMEGALYQGEYQKQEMLLHSSNPKCIDWIKSIHGDVWNLANNHIMDCGADALEQTLSLAQANAIDVIGAGRTVEEAATPLYLENHLVGMLAVGTPDYCERATADHPGCLLWDEDAMIRTKIEEIRNTCQYCIFVVHGGDEFCDIPFPHIRKRYRDFLNWGADVIVAHHPHVVQNYETVGKKMIFYSLGNFVFDTDYQRLQPHSDIGVLLKLDIAPEQIRWEAKGVRLNRESYQIQSCVLPAVFQDMHEKEYAQYGAVASAAYLKRYEKKRVYLDPARFEKMTSAQWRITHLKRSRTIDGRAALLGAIRSRMQSYQNVDQALMTYLRQT